MYSPANVKRVLKLIAAYSSFFLTRYGYFWYIEMLVITSGKAMRQNTEGGFPSKRNCSKAVTRSADTITNPCIQYKRVGNLYKVTKNKRRAVL